MDYAELSAIQRLHYINSRQLFEALAAVADLSRIRRRLAEQARINVAVAINRVPMSVAERGVLTGSDAVYAYEAAAGVHIRADLFQASGQAGAARAAFQAVAINVEGWPVLLRAADPRDFTADDRLAAVVRTLVAGHLAGMLAAGQQKSPAPDFSECRASSIRLPTTRMNWPGPA